MTLREKVARAMAKADYCATYAGDALNGAISITWESYQHKADAALAVVRKALNEAEQTMLNAMAKAQDSGTTDLDCLLAYAMEASPLAEGNGDA